MSESLRTPWSLGGKGVEFFGAAGRGGERRRRGIRSAGGGVGDLLLVEGVELGVGFALAGDEGEDEVVLAAGDGEFGVGGERFGIG